MSSHQSAQSVEKAPQRSHLLDSLTHGTFLPSLPEDIARTAAGTNGAIQAALNWFGPGDETNAILASITHVGRAVLAPFSGTVQTGVSFVGGALATAAEVGTGTAEATLGAAKLLGGIVSMPLNVLRLKNPLANGNMFSEGFAHLFRGAKRTLLGGTARVAQGIGRTVASFGGSFIGETWRHLKGAFGRPLKAIWNIFHTPSNGAVPAPVSTAHGGGH